MTGKSIRFEQPAYANDVVAAGDPRTVSRRSSRSNSSPPQEEAAEPCQHGRRHLGAVLSVRIRRRGGPLAGRTPVFPAWPEVPRRLRIAGAYPPFLETRDDPADARPGGDAERHDIGSAYRQLRRGPAFGQGEARVRAESIGAAGYAQSISAASVNAAALPVDE